MTMIAHMLAWLDPFVLPLSLTVFLVSLLYVGYLLYSSGRQTKDTPKFTYLKAEAITSTTAIKDCLERLPKQEEATAIVEGVKAKNLSFEVLDALPSGWVLFPPNLPLNTLEDELTEEEFKGVISYADAWHRVLRFERHYAAYYDKLVDLTSKLKDPNYDLCILETAVQVRGSLRQLVIAVRDLRLANGYLCGTIGYQELPYSQLEMATLSSWDLLSPGDEYYVKEEERT